MPQPDEDGTGAFVRALVTPTDPPPAAIGLRQRRRFDIYRNNVAHGMIEALGASFPAVERLVGPEFFAALARAFLAEEPPRSPILFQYGAGFGAFIDSFPPAETVPYLGDIARLEWARVQAHHAEDAEPAPITALSTVPPDALAGTRLHLHPSATLLHSRHPAYAIWAASMGAADAETVDLKRAEATLTHRPALDVETRHIAPASAAFLSALAAGAPLGDAATAATETDEAFDLGAELTGVFAIGAIAGISPPPD
ncbi:MAG: DNA-binding domain-containing protein [Pseudomonadota bacterium]